MTPAFKTFFTDVTQITTLITIALLVFSSLGITSVVPSVTAEPIEPDSDFVFAQGDIGHAANDTEGPVTSNLAVAPDPTNTNPTLTATIDDSSTGGSLIAGAEYFIDSDPGQGLGIPLAAVDLFDSATEDVTGTVDISGLADGTYTVSVRGQDAEGNWGSPSSLDFVVDTTGPDISVDVTDPDQVYKNGDTINLLVTEKNSETGLAVTGKFTTVDSSAPPLIPGFERGGGEYSLTYTISLTNTEDDGTKRIDVTATDAAGNDDTSFEFITLDNTPPTIGTPSTAPAFPTCSDQVDVFATITDDSGIAIGSDNFPEVTLSYTVVLPTESLTSETGSVTMIDPDGDSVYSLLDPINNSIAQDRHKIVYQISATDTEGNIATTGDFDYTYDCADPTANAGGPYGGNEGDTITFDASGSTDTVNDIVSYTWNFGDDVIDTVTTATTSHTYADNKPGEAPYSVTLTVTDAAGHTSVPVTITVPIANVAPTADAGPDQSGDIGQLLTFDASGSSDPGASDVLTYTWDFDDSATATGLSATHSYSQSGTYTVTLTVTDDDGASDTDTATVTINNAPPIADANGPYSETEGSPITFDASGSSDAGGTIVLYEWDFMYDGTFVADLNTTASMINYTYLNDFDGEAAVRVTDNEAAWAIGTATVTVANADPQPVLSVPGGTVVDEGDIVTFDASGSSDPGVNDVLSYTWDFGDSSTATGSVVDHTYADDGTYTVTLTVADEDGGSAQTTVEITVNNVAPTANADGPYTGDEGEPVFFTGSATDPGADTLTFTWDFGDGTAGVGSAVSHIYTADGAYNVTLTVDDGDGGTTTAPTTATITDQPPTASFAVSGDLTEGGVVQFTDTSTSPADPIVSWFWDFDDGTNSTDQHPTHIYADDGDYDVTLTVTDADGSTASATQTVSVADAGPLASFTHDAPKPEGEAVQFTDTSSPGDGDPVTAWLWDFGDGTSSSEQHPTHAYADNRTYTVTLIVTDSDNSTGTASMEIEILNADPIADAGPDLAGTVGEELTFDASNSTDPGTADVLTYSWDFGDGSPLLSGIIVNHTYTAKGTFNVILTVQDDDGGVSTDQLIVTIGDFVLAFHEGWNLFSIPKEANESAVTSVLDGLRHNGILTYDNGEWLSVCGDTDNCDLQTIDPLFAYWIHLSEPAGIAITFEETDAPNVKPSERALPTGWNLVGVSSEDATVAPDTLLLSVASEMKQAFIFTGDAWALHLPDGNPDNDDTVAMQGSGLWIFMDSAGTLLGQAF